MTCKKRLAYCALPVLLLALGQIGRAQQTQQIPVENKPADDTKSSDDLIVLTPFEVKADASGGYLAKTTLAGNHLNTDVRDIGNAVTVIAPQFLKDIGATDNQTLLQYTPSTEVGNVLGNFAGSGDGSLLDESNHFISPNTNTRVRGLAAADNSRDLFLTDIPWEGFDVDGVDLERGPNSILFGQGSPAGMINVRLKLANFKDANEVSFKVDNHGSTRVTLDINKVLIPSQLALRVAAVNHDTKYQEKPAFNNDRRIYAAVRYEPKFLKIAGSRTVIKANIEAGKINSNNPRQLPPIDLITPWFYTGTYQGTNLVGAATTYNNLNKITISPADNEDDNTGKVGHGTNRNDQNGPKNSPYAGGAGPYYQPWVGNFGEQFGNPIIYFNNNSNTPISAYGNAQYMVYEPQSAYGLINGTSTNNIPNPNDSTKVIGGPALPFQRPVGVAPYATFAQNAKLKFYDIGVYKDKSLTDASVFDFYNKLLDGPTKWEWQNFRSYNISLEQTFFDDQIGFNLIYNRENISQGRVGLLAGDQQGIAIDFSSSYPDGTANPNVGRPYVSGTGHYTNSSRTAERTYTRALVFARHDFSKDMHNWFGKLLGSHSVTGLAESYKLLTDDRAWQLYGADSSWLTTLNSKGANNTVSKFWSGNVAIPDTVIYLGPSLSGAASAAGANIPAPTAVPVLPDGNAWTFNSTWNAPASVDYNARTWYNPYYANSPFYAGIHGGDDTKTPPVLPVVGQDPNDPNTLVGQQDPAWGFQANNPANYVGYSPFPIKLVNSLSSKANQDTLTNTATLNKEAITTTAFTWQGKFWNNFLIGTYGVRKDVRKAYTTAENVNGTGIYNTADGHLILSPDIYKLSDIPNASGGRIQVTSHAWTAVAHLNELPLLDKLPINVSLYYNVSTDFQPAQARVDVYGEALAPPSGKTIDRGILLETKDGKYSLKINRYVNDSKLISTPALSYSWFIGSSQAWGGNWANRFEFNWTQDSNAGAVAVNDPTNSQYNYSPAPGETQADAAAREASVVAAWRAWQKSVDPRFYAAWGINLNDPSKGIGANTPNGFAIPEDNTSKGYEIEFSALPTKNWRLTFNASKTNATRYNVGGTNLIDFVTKYQTALAGGAPGTAGDLRIWWGGAGNETTLQEWYSGNQPFGTQYALVKQQEGTNVPELREWRFNAISNYDFDHGFLKGVNVGVGVRYQSAQTLGYPPIPDASVQNLKLQLDKPFKTDSEIDFDAWIGYSRRIMKNIDWNIQLNIRNIGVGNELIPVTVEPDGTPATYRIRPSQLVELTNTFKF